MIIEQGGATKLIAIFLGLIVCINTAFGVELTTNNTVLNLGGYLKLDAIWNDVSSGDDAHPNIQYWPRSVPLYGNTLGETNEFVLNARESRLFVETKTMMGNEQLYTYWEIDFDTEYESQLFTNSRLGRLRQAYVKYGNWTFGQTWSLFMHLESLPELNDFGGPTGQVFARQPLVRYSYSLGMASTLEIGIENPETFYFDGSELSLSDDDEIPDIVFRYSYESSTFQLSTAIMYRKLIVDRHDMDWSINDSAESFSYQFAGSYSLPNNHRVYGQYNAGEGIGRYSSLTTHPGAYINSKNRLELIDVKSGFIGYEAQWGGEWRWRSNIIIGFTDANNNELVTDVVTQSTKSIHVNLLYNPLESIRIGIEFIKGKRTVYDRHNGELNRLEVSVKTTF